MTRSLHWWSALPLGLACASYQGSARDVTPEQLAAEGGQWRRIDRVALVRQQGAKDCGAAALSTVLRYWQPAPGRSGLERDSIDAALRESPDQGLSAGELRDYARRHGFFAYVFQGSFSDLKHEVEQGRPVIVGVTKPLSSGEALAHFEVFIGYDVGEQQVLTLDPAHGLRRNGVDAFLGEWEPAGRVTLVIFADPAAERRGDAGLPAWLASLNGRST